MSYRKPTELEIRISERLQDIAKRTERIMQREFGTKDFHFFIFCTPKEPVTPERERNILDAPVANYVANMERQGAAMTMIELLQKWQLNKDLPPIHQWQDARNQTLEAVRRATMNDPNDEV